MIITGFAATPATITYGHATVTVSGKLVECGSQTIGVPDEPVQVEFGTSTAISTSTGADGSFSAAVSLPKGGNVFAEFNGDTAYGYTRTRVPAAGDGNKLLPSASTTYAGLVSDQTCVTGLTVSRGRARTEVEAQVQDSCATGQRSFGKVSGQVAEVYYHPRGSTTWSLLGQARTDANGFVDYTNGDALRGYFKVVFPAQGYYLGSTTQTG